MAWKTIWRSMKNSKIAEESRIRKLGITFMNLNKNTKIKLPEEILCFELLRNANITKPEKTCQFKKKKKVSLFDQAKKSLKKIQRSLLQVVIWLVPLQQ